MDSIGGRCAPVLARDETIGVATGWWSGVQLPIRTTNDRKGLGRSDK